ncbi:MAG: prepilin-type N-terminal cleavage/methylation domain-containing protein [Gemmatimonadetes bacterium]|nr:prepilin-type N-terminal cleavage/methylation domain-containing protein [Gemmatimonadota bacterium]
MRTYRWGFSLIEVLFVIVIGAVLMAIAIPKFGQVQLQRAVANARDSFVLLGARARITSIERGRNVKLGLDPQTDRAWICVTPCSAASDTLEIVQFRDDFTAEVDTPSDALVVVCYTPRGYANTNCSTGLTGTITVEFEKSGQKSKARIQPLGQVSKI